MRDSRVVIIAEEVRSWYARISSSPAEVCRQKTEKLLPKAVTASQCEVTRTCTGK